MVIVALGELRSSWFVQKKRHVGMKLQGRSGDGARDGAFDRFRDGGGFGVAGGEQENFARFENCADSHGDGAARAFLPGAEELRIVVKRFAAQGFETRARRQARGRLVEADMPVTADAENLEVNPTGGPDRLLVGSAVSIVVSADATVGNVHIARRHVYVAKEILLHEVLETLRMRAGQALVFVKIERADLREIERACLVQANELLVEADHGAAGGKAERERWFFLDRAGDEQRGLLVHFFVVALQDDQHAQPFRTSRMFSSRER